MNYVRPGDNEYAPYYATYVDKVGDGDIFSILSAQLHHTLALLRPLTDEQGNYQYAEGKWSIKEVVGHIVDSERIFCYRALRGARADEQPLPGFEQDDYVDAANFNNRSLEGLLDEFSHVRTSNLLFFKSLSATDLMRTVVASNVVFTVRALLYIIAGHELHHVQVLNEKYLQNL